jgi:hypothetical protein
MSDLKAIQNKPEGRQFYSSILNYMESDKFIPATAITQNDLVALFKTKVASKTVTGVKNISY